MNIQACILILIVMPAISTAAYPQGTAPQDRKKLPEILTRMKSTDLHTQKLAFDDLMNQINFETSGTRAKPEALNKYFSLHPEQADQVKLGLTQLLSQENYYFVESKNPPPDSHEEDDIGEHYAELIDVVSSLEDDRAIPALVGAMTTGGIAQRGLMKYGDKALVPVLGQLKNRDALVRAAALGMGIALLERQNDSASQARIRELIRSSLADPKPVVRTHSIREIGCLADRQDFVPMLQQIAKTDPWKLPGKADDGGDGDEFYPVRSDARQILRDIQNNKACTP
jgi:hypothetical protein